MLTAAYNPILSPNRAVSRHALINSLDDESPATSTSLCFIIMPSFLIIFDRYF